MESIVSSLILIVLTLAVPFVAYGFLYGLVLCKRLFIRELLPKKTKGLAGAVQTWQDMSSDERMEASGLQQEAATRWLNSPTPEEEQEKMNERVYEEGMRHHLPETEVQTDKEVKNIRP